MRVLLDRLDMRATVVLLIMVAFGVMLVHDPKDETLRGALIAAFSAAWGYYLGSSNSARERGNQVQQAVGVAQSAIDALPTPPQSVTIDQPPAKPVPVQEAG